MFYEYFLKLCNKKGVTPSRAALDNGISKTSVTRWKNGAQPNSDIVKRLSVYFSVPTDYLLGSASTDDEISQNDIKFALFGTTDIDDDVLEDVRRYAKYVKERQKDENGKDT